MGNKEKYNRAFIEALDVEEDQLNDLNYMDVPNWDSVGHMSLISELEEAFDIQMETDDIVDFGSYVKGMDLLRKYGVIIE